MTNTYILDAKKKFWVSPYETPATIKNFIPEKVSTELYSTTIADFYSQGIGGYFEQCWGDHGGLVITPDLLWQLAFSEFVKIVVAHPEEFRKYFTTSQEKQDIIVMGPLPIETFITSLIAGVKEKSPFDVSRITPEFTTSTGFSYLTSCALTLECVSQYYDYCMYMCGFPSITVKGDRKDWEKLYKAWYSVANMMLDVAEKFPQLKDNGEWAWNLLMFLSDKLLMNLEDQDFWSNMYIGEKCGSGSDFYVSGWITKFICELDKDLMGKNFPHGIATVNYKNLTTDTDYKIFAGVIGSNKLEQEDGTVILEPVHGMVVVGDHVEYCGCIGATKWEPPVKASKNDIIIIPAEEPKKLRLEVNENMPTWKVYENPCRFVDLRGDEKFIDKISEKKAA